MPHCMVRLIQDAQTLAQYFSRNGEFSFYVPEGQFRLRAFGNVMRSIEQDVEITSIGQSNELSIDLPATRLTMLQGTKAPEFEEVMAWKNGPGLQPADCHGRYILIDFWGHWCGPCLRNMPHLIDLHEQLGDKGLTIVGIHVDSGDDVDTVGELDEKLHVVREKLWEGRDIPFPVALVRAHKILAEGRNDDDARSLTAAAYGVASYPTCVLVDPSGRIVREFHVHNALDRQLLTELVTHVDTE